MLLIFRKMADVDHCLAKSKEKEISSSNIGHLLPRFLNWRHLLGLEAIAMFLQSSVILNAIDPSEQTNVLC